MSHSIKNLIKAVGSGAIQRASCHAFDEMLAGFCRKFIRYGPMVPASKVLRGVSMFKGPSFRPFGDPAVCPLVSGPTSQPARFGRNNGRAWLQRRSFSRGTPFNPRPSLAEQFDILAA